VQRGVTRLEQATATLGTTPAGWQPARLATASADLRDASRDLDAGSSRLHANLLVRATLFVPALRDQSRAVLDLAVSAQDGVAAMGDLIEVAEKYQNARTSVGPVGPRFVAFISVSSPELVDVQDRIDRTLARLRGDLRHPLLPPIDHQVRAAIQKLQPARDAAAPMAALARYLPAAVGENGPRTYLLLFTNPDELRPAGGFVGSFGVITVDRGAPSLIDVRGEQDLDGRYRVRFPIPAALGARLSFPNNSLDIGDAGWDPDFRSSATLSEQMLGSATGRTVDGTIAIDPYAMAALLRITGPVDVPQYGTLTADNFFSRVNQIVNVEAGPSSGKKALPVISAAIVKHLFTTPIDAWPQMMATAGDAARGRHVQLYLHDVAVAQALDAARYDGSFVNPPDGKDYLMVVDANVGGTKGDGYVRKSAEARVEVVPGSLIRHELVLRYAYPTGISDPAVPKRGDTGYRDYVRLYLPETSSLTGFYQIVDQGARGGAVQEISVDRGKRVVGTYFRLESGHSLELHVFFTVPADSEAAYRLHVQKQAGILARPVDLLISYPRGLAKRRLAGDRDSEVAISW
jgi:hypothetical protein